jgi:hypothetical protein
MNTGNQLPPRLNQPQTSIGRIGLWLSLVAPATIAVMALLHPG